MVPLIAGQSTSTGVQRPTTGIPLAWPNAVDATDDFLCVSDIVNIRLLRLAKTFQAKASAAVPGP